MELNSNLHTDPNSFLHQDYNHWRKLFEGQPNLIQRYLENQAQSLVDGLKQSATQLRFTLPNQIICEDQQGNLKQISTAVPEEFRKQNAGSLLRKLGRTPINVILRDKLNELEASADPAVATSAGLIRFAIALNLVYVQLPDGKTVHYQALEGETIPSIPENDLSQPDSAITETTDAIVEEKEENAEQENRGSLQVPYASIARQFYLPQWIAFDENDRLLVGSFSEAEAHLHSMQHFLHHLHLAVSVTPYIIADDLYQRKRYGILGELVNQGRAMARYETKQIIETIQKRAEANYLNRGLSLSLPYFDDQILDLKTYELQVIPAGRILFIPAFVVRASRLEQVKIAQDTRLSPSTRNHLLSELQTLEIAFLEA